MSVEPGPARAFGRASLCFVGMGSLPHEQAQALAGLKSVLMVTGLFGCGSWVDQD